MRFLPIGSICHGCKWVQRALSLSKSVILKPLEQYNQTRRPLSLSKCFLICDRICVLAKWTHGAHPWLQSTGTWQCSIRETTNNVQCGWLMLGCDVKIDFGINLWERFTFRLTAIDSSDCPRLVASIPSQQGGYSRGELYFSHGCWRQAPISSLTQKVAPSDKTVDLWNISYFGKFLFMLRRWEWLTSTDQAKGSGLISRHATDAF